MKTENDAKGGVIETAAEVETKPPLFPRGLLVLKKGVREKLPFTEVVAGLTRHTLGDWGNLDALDRRHNENGLHHGGRLWSAFRASNGVKFWILTKGDRSVTTVLLPRRN